MKNRAEPDRTETLNRCYSGQEFRALETNEGEKVIEGHPAIYNSTTQIGTWFNEIIERGAFDNTDMTDVALFINHQQHRFPLARSRRNNGNSTMTLTVDDKGLAMRATLDVEHNEEARAVYSAVSRGDMDGMSFSFKVQDEEWENLDSDMPTRRIKAISKIYEVSVVTYPAYKDTDVYARADKEPLDSGERELENARQKALLEKRGRRSVDTDSEIEKYRLRIGILGGM